MQIAISSNSLHVLTPSRYVRNNVYLLYFLGNEQQGGENIKEETGNKPRQAVVIVHENSTSSLFKSSNSTRNIHAKLTCPLTSELYQELDIFKLGGLYRRKVEWNYQKFRMDNSEWLFKNIFKNILFFHLFQFNNRFLLYTSIYLNFFLSS